MKVLVLGARGLLGHVIVEEAQRSGHETIARGHSSEPSRVVATDEMVCDVEVPESISLALECNPDVVINCTAIIDTTRRGNEQSIRVNSVAPHTIARLSTMRRIRLIHVSTDAVFSGDAGPYSEADVPAPTSLYGHSKFLGEVTYGAHVTVRTSFIGRDPQHHRGLLEWLLSSSGEVKGYRHVYWSGLTSVALARLLLRLAGMPDVTGLIHVGGERVSKFELLSLLQRAYEKSDINIVPTDAPFHDTSLISHRLADIGIAVPPLAHMVNEMVRTETER